MVDLCRFIKKWRGWGGFLLETNKNILRINQFWMLMKCTSSSTYYLVVYAVNEPLSVISKTLMLLLLVTVSFFSKRLVHMCKRILLDDTCQRSPHSHTGLSDLGLVSSRS